jgi:hypothetical protein
MTLTAVPTPTGGPEDEAIENPITDRDVERILKAVVRAAGPAGIERNDMLSQAETIADEISGLKVGAAIYAGFARGLLVPFVNTDGEVAWCAPEHLESATGHLRCPEA